MIITFMGKGGKDGAMKVYKQGFIFTLVRCTFLNIKKLALKSTGAPSTSKHRNTRTSGPHRCFWWAHPENRNTRGQPKHLSVFCHRDSEFSREEEQLAIWPYWQWTYNRTTTVESSYCTFSLQRSKEWLNYRFIHTDCQFTEAQNESAYH